MKTLLKALLILFMMPALVLAGPVCGCTGAMAAVPHMMGGMSAAPHMDMGHPSCCNQPTAGTVLRSPCPMTSAHFKGEALPPSQLASSTLSGGVYRFLHMFSASLSSACLLSKKGTGPLAFASSPPSSRAVPLYLSLSILRI